MYLNRRHLYNFGSMDRINRAEKVVKDLSFLLQIPKSIIEPNLIKYQQRQGEGKTLQEITIPAIFYISFIKFDYEGRFLSQIKNVTIRNLQEERDASVPKGVYSAIRGMKLNEKSWFNMKSAYLHETQQLKHKGCHFQIIVEDVKYKNSDLMESKQILYERSKKQGKQHFLKKNYEQALKKYKNIINITGGLDKKKYSSEDLDKLALYNLNGKENYLRCFIKLNDFDEIVSESAEQYSKELVQMKGDKLSFFLRARTLLKRKYLTDGLECAEKLYEMDPSGENLLLIKEIKEIIQKK